MSERQEEYRVNSEEPDPAFDADTWRCDICGGSLFDPDCMAGVTEEGVLREMLA